MPYNELIKNFDKIRDYMRDFYVYGFKTREDFNKKSNRSYDNEKRRIESYLGDYIYFNNTSSGKNVFISIDSKNTSCNPLYKVFKTKSFTDGDITLHFIIFDILISSEISLSLKEITEIMYEDYFSKFSCPILFDESTIRKKLNEYIKLGLIRRKKNGRQILYSRTLSPSLNLYKDAVSFFSEAALLGVIGSFVFDRFDKSDNYFTFKHHYITHVLESEILYELFNAISEQKEVHLKIYKEKMQEEKILDVVPLKIFVSSQTGRRYLIGKCVRFKDIISVRLDSILKVTLGNSVPNFYEIRKKAEKLQKHTWGVAYSKRNNELEHIDFTVHIEDNEKYILSRLEREKRCGTVCKIDKNTYKFETDVYDSGELIPWIRTFICRIIDINFSNKTLEDTFKKDLEDMYNLYGV